jgi:hypothetical protein
MTTEAEWNKWLGKLSDAVLAELREPSDRYPVEPANRRALATMIGMDSALELERHAVAEDNYFTKLGMQVSRWLADDTLRQHLGNGPMAHDAMPSAMRPRGPRQNYDQAISGGSAMPMSNNYDQDPNEPNGGQGHGATAEQCLAHVAQIMDGFDDDEQRSMFIEGLSNLVSSDGELEITHRPDDNGNGPRQRNGQGRANMPSYDRRPAQDRALASRNSASYQRRWGHLTGNISFSGTGR